MSFSLDQTTIHDTTFDVMDLQLYDDQLPQPMELDIVDSQPAPISLKSIIKKRSFAAEFFGKVTTRGLKRKCVVFRDPISEVRLYDKVAAKRQQWGPPAKFSRVKKFCWDKEEDLDAALERETPLMYVSTPPPPPPFPRRKQIIHNRNNRWLPNETDQDYRLMMWRDMQQRRENRKRRVNGDDLAYLVQALEISPNCYEMVTSKMRRMETRL